eukprot:6777166-Pyramimonas_sp.AAC.3
MATFWTQHLSQNSTHGQKSSWPWRRSCGWAPPSSDLSTCLLRPLLFYNNITSSGVLSAPLPLLLAQEEDPRTRKMKQFYNPDLKILYL